MQQSQFQPITDIHSYGIAFLLFVLGGIGLFVLEKKVPKSAIGIFVGSLGIGIVVRIWSAIHFSPFSYDFQTFYAWAEGLYQASFAEFYRSQSFVDYPPGYMYVLYLVALAHHFFGFDQGSVGSAVLLKAPAMFADVAIASLFVWIGNENGKRGLGSVVAALYLLNPVSILNSAIWGQVDSVFSLLMLLAVWQLQKKAYSVAGICYALAILIKPQGLLFGPVFLFAALSYKPWISWGKMLFSGGVAFLIGIFPFAIHQQPLWIYTLYKKTLGSYPYYSVNAYNVVAWLGGNWKKLPPSSEIISTFVLLGIVLISGVIAWKNREKQEMPVVVAVWVILSVFYFAFKMHERYLFPALVFVPMVWLWTKQVRWGIILGLITLAQLINVGFVYVWFTAPQQGMYAMYESTAIAWSAALLGLAWISTTYFGFFSHGGQRLEK
jgi:Gpi18-like mannosyltransferase